MMCRFLSLFFLLIAFSQSLVAQTTAPKGGWAMYFGRHELRNPRWLVYTEVQFRDRIAGQQREQLLIRAGVGYNLNENWTLAAGAATVSNYTDKTDWGHPVNMERRMFLQQIHVFKWKNIQVENRFRQEYRVLTNRLPFRFRHRILASIPLKTLGLKSSRWKIHVYNEYFLQTATATLDRNRLYAALGYRWSHAEIQFGYLLQTVPLGYTGEYLQVALLVF